MMRMNRMGAMLMALILLLIPISGVGENDLLENEIVAFRPVDCGVQAQEVYEYPFMGMTATLSQMMLEKIDSREVFVRACEDYTQDGQIKYALLRFSATTEEEREQEGMSVDFIAWEESLEKVGALGVYRSDMEETLDELTACDTHQKLGESADGAYAYYLSVCSEGNTTLTEELQRTQLTISEMHELDMEMGYSAFSADRVEGVNNVGNFSTMDVFGNVYTQTFFQQYNLTLVNAFATWCSPCVQEMPELEELRKTYEEKGIKLGVVGVVLDTKTQLGTDENAVERAKVLYQRSGAQFPFMMPDETNMNDRLTGIESVPETFFVDRQGNIVSDPYVGARSMEAWSQIVDQELAKVQGAQ